jgi:hypothetical protein
LVEHFLFRQNPVIRCPYIYQKKIWTTFMVFILYQTDFDVNLTLENPKKKRNRILKPVPLSVRIRELLD